MVAKLLPAYMMTCIHTEYLMFMMAVQLLNIYTFIDVSHNIQDDSLIMVSHPLMTNTNMPKLVLHVKDK